MDYCRHRAHVLVVNDNWLLAPWADVLYAVDGPWWDTYYDEVRPGFAGECWTGDGEAARKYALHRARLITRGGLSADPAVIHEGYNSGYQAIGLAYHLGARRIVLLGFDMKLDADGKRHWFGDHPGELNKASDYGKWLQAFKTLPASCAALGVEIINCTRDTAIQCFPRAALRDTI